MIKIKICITYKCIFRWTNKEVFYVQECTEWKTLKYESFCFLETISLYAQLEMVLKYVFRKYVWLPNTHLAVSVDVTEITWGSDVPHI